MSDIIRFDVSLEQRQQFAASINQKTLTETYLDKLKSFDVGVYQSFYDYYYLKTQVAFDKEL